MTMHNPPHPGRLLKHQLIQDEDGKAIASVAAVAEKLGCHRNTLNNLIRGKQNISPAMALALEHNGNSSAEFWMNLQTAYDLFVLRQLSVA